MYGLLVTLSVALTALAGPIPPKPGQPAPGLEGVFFVPVKVKDTGLCFDDNVAGNIGDAVTASTCKGDFGSWIWKPVEDGYYHLTLFGMDRCVGFDLRGESCLPAGPDERGRERNGQGFDRGEGSDHVMKSQKLTRPESNKPEGTPIVLTDCAAPGFQHKWLWKGDNLCTDGSGGKCPMSLLLPSASGQVTRVT